MPTPLTRTKTVLYSAASVGSGAFYAFNNFVLPQILKAAGGSDLLVGLLSSTRSIEGAVIQPTIGVLSDRTRTRFGRRRPFMAAAIPLSAAFFLYAATQHDLLGLAVSVFLFSIFFNIAADPYVALLADITEVEERGILQGVSMGIQLASQVLFLLVIAFGSTGEEKPSWSFPVVAALLLVSFGITILGVREPTAIVDHTEERLGLRGYVAALLEHRQAMVFLGAIFVFMFGFNPVLAYLTLFIVNDIGEPETTALALAAGTLLVTALAAVASGRLADRVGTKPVLVLGWFLLAIAAFAGIVVHGLSQVIAVALVAGVGNGAQTAVSWPLLASLVPVEKNGVFAGLKAAAESIAIPLSIFVAAEVFLPRFSYRGAFVLLAAGIVVALLILTRFVHAPALPNPGAAAG